MLDNYTNKAKQALEKAKEWSEKLSCGYIGSEHILLGLMSVEDCVASKLLETNSVDKDTLIKKISEFSNKKDNVVKKLSQSVNTKAFKEKYLSSKAMANDYKKFY